jgi:hypothetical protein
MYQKIIALTGKHVQDIITTHDTTTVLLDDRIPVPLSIFVSSEDSSLFQQCPGGPGQDQMSHRTQLP